MRSKILYGLLVPCLLLACTQRAVVRPATPLTPMRSALGSFPTGGCCSATSTGSATSTNQTAEIDLLTTIANNTTGGGSLPVGAATAARQDTGNASLASIDTKTPALVGGRVPVDPSGVTSPVSIASTVTVTGPLTDTQLRASAVPISAASLPLMTGAATSALQTTGNTTLSSIYSQLLSTLTADVSDRAGRLLGVVYGSQAQQLQQSPTNYNLYTELRTGGTAYDGRQIRALTSSDQVTTVPSGTQAVTGPLTDTQLRASAVPISAASLPLPTNAATSALQGGGLPSALVGGRLDVNIGASGVTVPVSGPATDAQLRATPLPVSGTVTSTPSGTQTVTGTVTANLGTTAGGAGQLALDATMTGGTQTTRITDGTNTANVKAASTAAGATDKALVVAVSPNNSVAGTNAAASQVDGHSATLGATTDTGSALTVVGLLKAVKALLGGGLPSTLVAGRIDTNIGAFASTAMTIGAQTASTSIPVTIATDNVVAVKGNAATGAAVSGNPNLVAGKDSAGNVQPIALDTTGRWAGSSKTFITTNVTTQVIKAGAGVVRGLIINPGITSAFLLYDSNGASSGQFSGGTTAAPAYLYSVQFGPNGVAFSTGLTITTSGGTPASVLVIYD